MDEVNVVIQSVLPVQQSLPPQKEKGLEVQSKSEDSSFDRTMRMENKKQPKTEKMKREEAPKEEKLFVSKSLHIASQIIAIMERKKMLQKDFAVLMGKTEPEISKWLSGFHNFTIKTITKIEAELDETIITTPKKVFEDIGDVIDKFVSSINKTNVINTSVLKQTNGIEFNTTISKMKTECKILTFIPAHLESKTNTETLTGTYF